MKVLNLLIKYIHRLNELKENLRRYLAGSIGVEIIKKQKHAINPQDLDKAYALASKIVEDYKMSKDANELILNISNEVKIRTISK